MVLLLLAMLGGAYLATHFVVERVRARFLIVSGIEYVLLGLLLGPAVFPTLAPFDDLTSLGPVFAFAAGWVGLLYGLELPLRSFDLIGPALRIALVDTTVTATTVAFAAHAFFVSGWLMPAVPVQEAWMSAGVLGCAAAAGSSSAVDLVQARYPSIKTGLLPLLRRTARLEDLIAIVAFGVLFCVFHRDTLGTLTRVGPSDWFLLTLGIGIVLGLLFFAFIGKDNSENHVFLAIVGTLLLASGAAFFLLLSALLVNLVLGLILIQTRHGAAIGRQLERTAKPVSVILLIFAGALYQRIPPLPAAALITGFFLLRGIGKTMGTALATMGTPFQGNIYRGLFAQGDAAVAIALSFRLVYDGPSVDLVYATILSGVIVHEMLAPRILRGLLIDTGDLRHDTPAASTEGHA